MKSISRLTLGIIVAAGTVSQASPTLAELYTKPFSTPKGDGIITYDSVKDKLIYSIGDSNTPFSSSGEFQWNPNNLRGTNVGQFKEENGATGTYFQDFPLGGSTSTNGNSTSHYDPSTNTVYGSYDDHGYKGGYFMQFGGSNQAVSETPVNVSTYDPNTSQITSYGTYSSNGITGGYYGQYTIPSFTDSTQPNDFGTGATAGITGMVTRTFSTPQGDGIYTYDIKNNKTTWILGNPNSPFYSTGDLQYDKTTSRGSIDVYYQNDFTYGGYSVKFGDWNTEAVPEPDSVLLNTLAFGGVISAGLLLKRQQKKVRQ